MRLQNRVALITGAARGIGLGIAQAFAREGARLALVDLDALGLLEAQARVEAEGGEALAFPLDVTDGRGVRAAVSDLVARWGRVDVLVNNAGIYEIVPFVEIDEARWDRVLAVNLKGAFLFTQAVIEPMMAQGGGRIVSIASSAGKTGGTLAGAHYSVSKAGIICLTKQLARELGPHGITVNAVAPGRIDTPMIQAATEAENEEFRRRTPLGRLGTPEDVAGAVLFLASDEASFITGEIIDVNGGLLID